MPIYKKGLFWKVYIMHTINLAGKAYTRLDFFYTQLRVLSGTRVA